jgi:hypothetical protein
VSDGQEFRQGTDPTNAGSVFRVLTLTTVTSPQPQPFAQRSTAVFWAAAPFRSYRVQYKNDLEAPWTDLAGDVVATGNTASKTHLVFPAGSSRAFYRVRLLD